MASVLETTKPVGPDNLAEKLDFSKGLQAVTNKIHATSNLDEIMLELSQEITGLFNADRLTIYALSEDKQSIISKIKTGLVSFKDLRLPINDQSIAGFVAVNKKIINIRDVYDDKELKAYSPQLNFLKQVDLKTGYRTKQMLVGPVSDPQTKELVGVVQLINAKNGQPFPPAMEEGMTHLCETLSIAFRQRAHPQQVSIRGKYDQLVTNAIITAEELELAARSSRRKNLDIETVLIEEFQVKAGPIGDALAAYFGVPYEAFKGDRVKPFDLLKNISREFLESSAWLPLEDNKDGLLVMTTDPEKVRGSRMVNNVFPKAKAIFKVSTQREFIATLDQFFGSGGAPGAVDDGSSIGDLLDGMGTEEGAADDGANEDAASAASDNEVVKLVNKVIIDAYQQGASDIHVEPYPGKQKTEIRFRKDGSLVPYISVPAAYRSAIAARLKIMCDLDISERRKPQDGKIKFKKYGPLDIELRVATIPSTGGVEDVVMRILAAGEPIPLEKLGLTPHNKQRLEKTVSKPYGLFYVCGPTGSGKTTTLHSILKFLNTPDTKIWTAEDPVEITQKGLRQVQINKKAGIDFALVMRAFLRADPDIIMVGESRDKETVSMGVEASLTGHLVFSTLHTNSAPESITRLMDMGMDPFNFADALLGILAQRLAKKLCDCKQSYVPASDELRLFVAEYAEELRHSKAWQLDSVGETQKLVDTWSETYGVDGQLRLYRAVGCDKCGGTGYKGRIGLHELLVADDAVKKLIQERARVAELFAQSVEGGMRTLKMDGMEKIMMGLTDIKMVRSVCIK